VIDRFPVPCCAVELPEVRYLPTPRGAVAYQAFGSGARTIVWTSPPLLSIETRWDHPGNLRLWDFLSSFGRVVTFDYRGFGISEHLPLDRVGRLDEMSFDLGAVIEELTSPPVVLIATGTATLPVVHFVTSHPSAVERLVLLNATATDPLQGQVDPAEWGARWRDRWGTGDALIAAASGVLDDLRRASAARSERISATPAVVEAAIIASLGHDVRELLPGISVPTLVVHTGDLKRITPEMSERVAAAVPGAVFLERPSATFNWGEWEADIKRFVTGQDGDAEGYRDLATVVFTDIVGSTEHAARVGDAAWRNTLGYLDAFVKHQTAQRNGRVVKHTGDGHLLEFARPSDALAAARMLLKGSPELGVRLRAGIHYAEIERRPDGDIGGIGVHVAARIAALAEPDEILVSRTVTELTSGGGCSYVERGMRSLKGVPGEWAVYALAGP